MCIHAKKSDHTNAAKAKSETQSLRVNSVMVDLRQRGTRNVCRKKTWSFLYSKMWTVYLLRNAKASRTYTGITNDVKRRIRQHNGLEPGGAKSTRAGRPWSLVMYAHGFRNRGMASQLEYAVKHKYGPRRGTGPSHVVVNRASIFLRQLHLFRWRRDGPTLPWKLVEPTCKNGFRVLVRIRGKEWSVSRDIWPLHVTVFPRAMPEAIPIDPSPSAHRKSKNSPTTHSRST